MFPYIERAQRNGWEIMILNPNLNEIAYQDGDGMDLGGEGGLSFVGKHVYISNMLQNTAILILFSVNTTVQEAG